MIQILLALLNIDGSLEISMDTLTQQIQVAVPDLERYQPCSLQLY